MSTKTEHISVLQKAGAMHAWLLNLMIDALKWSPAGLSGKYNNVIIAANNLPPDWEGTLLYLLPRLNDRERIFILAYYRDHMNFQEIANQVSLTRERVRQIIHKGLAKLSAGDGASMLTHGIAEHYKLKQEMMASTLMQQHTINDQTHTKAVLHTLAVMPIEEMGLTVRTYNCLKRAGLDTVQDLLDTDLNGLKRVRNLGLHCIREICDKLRDMGFDTSNKEE